MMTEALDPSRRNEVGIFEQIEKLPPTTFEEKRGLHFSSVFAVSVGGLLEFLHVVLQTSYKKNKTKNAKV